MSPPGRHPLAWRPLYVLAVIFCAVLTVASPRYGYHRDELYFLTIGSHPV